MGMASGVAERLDMEFSRSSFANVLSSVNLLDDFRMFAALRFTQENVDFLVEYINLERLADIVPRCFSQFCEDNNDGSSGFRDNAHSSGTTAVPTEKESDEESGESYFDALEEYEAQLYMDASLDVLPSPSVYQPTSISYVSDRLLPHFLYFYAQYFSHDAPIDLNITSSARSNIQRSFIGIGSDYTSPQVPTTIFLEAAKEILSLLYYSTFRDYVTLKRRQEEEALAHRNSHRVFIYASNDDHEDEMSSDAASITDSLRPPNSTRSSKTRSSLLPGSPMALSIVSRIQRGLRVSTDLSAPPSPTPRSETPDGGSPTMKRTSSLFRHRRTGSTLSINSNSSVAGGVPSSFQPPVNSIGGASNNNQRPSSMLDLSTLYANKLSRFSPKQNQHSSDSDPLGARAARSARRASTVVLSSISAGVSAMDPRGRKDDTESGRRWGPSEKERARSLSNSRDTRRRFSAWMGGDSESDAAPPVPMIPEKFRKR